MSVPCLDNLVYIKGLTDTTGALLAVPANAMAIQDLPLCNIKNADAAISNDVESGVQLIKDKIGFAQELIVEEFISHLPYEMAKTTALEQNIAGHYIDNMLNVPAVTGYYKGIGIQLWEYQYLELFISSFTLILQNTVATNILVIDLITGKVLDTLPIDSIAGDRATIIVNKSYQNYGNRMNLFFCYDSGVSDSVNSQVYPAGLSYSGMGCLSCQGQIQPSGYTPYLRDAILDKTVTPSQNNLKVANDTGGLSLTYTLNCSTLPLICNYSFLLRTTLLYKAGSLIYQEMTHSKRLNMSMMTGKADWKELYEMYESMYQDKVNGVFKNIKLPNSICFQKYPKVQTITRVP